MIQPNHLLTYSFVVALTALISCRPNEDKEKNESFSGNPSTTVVSKDSVIKNGNVTMTFSSDIEKLGQLLDFKSYRPTSVKFKYTLIDNSGQSQRLSVPGPSDFSLQALLYFDAVTFEKFLDHDRHADYPSPNYNKDEFKFDWLANDIRNELNNSKDHYHGHPDFFFGTTNSRAWYLDKKILISNRTN